MVHFVTIGVWNTRVTIGVFETLVLRFDFRFQGTIFHFLDLQTSRFKTRKEVTLVSDVDFLSFSKNRKLEMSDDFSGTQKSETNMKIRIFGSDFVI